MHSFSVIIPAYNEETRLPATLEAVAGYLGAMGLERFEVLVVDDGSRDRTADVVREYSQRHPEVRLVSNPGNRGKGYAIRHGFQQASCEWVLFSDADLSAPIDELPKLIEAVRREHADGAIGSRALDRKLIGVRQSWFRETSGKFFNLVMRLITGLPFLDTQCGFKMFRLEAARLLGRLQRIESFGFDVEILYILKKHGYRVVEVPVRWNNAEGTKVSLWNGLSAFLDPLHVRRNDRQGLYEAPERSK